MNPASPDNLEQTIAAYYDALQVRTRDAFPIDWARTQGNLGSDYGKRVRGDRADNLEKAIQACGDALQVFTRDAFPIDWARTQGNLGSTYGDRIRGDRADNLEKAIQAFCDALQVYTRDAFPIDWARTQSILAYAYIHRIRGDRADNLERAIQAFCDALQVYTRDAFPIDWARTQSILPYAYIPRIRGDRADNLEKAIQAFRDALQVYTRDAFPIDWARTQGNLGSAYGKRVRGDRADNLEKAIQACGDALQVFTRDAFPIDWARTQGNLGSAYGKRVRGDRADNLEKAIQACGDALQVFTRDAFPIDWARTQGNLGSAYGDRIRGDRADNLEKAIQACGDALQVFTRDAFYDQWANTQSNLGSAYVDRIRGDRADNLEKAIQAFRDALQVYTRTAFPDQWADTQNNLGVAYRHRICGDRADNVERAIAACGEALQVHTRDAFPEQWAKTQNNLGGAYADRILGDRADNLEQAIQAFREALQVHTRDASPEQWAKTQNNLGVAYADRILGDRADNLEHAIAAYHAALQVHTRDASPTDWAWMQHNLAIAYRDRVRGDFADNLEQAIGAFRDALQVYNRDAYPDTWAWIQHNLGIAYCNRIRGGRADNLEWAIQAFCDALQVHTRQGFPDQWAKSQYDLGEAYRARIRGDKAQNHVEASRRWTEVLDHFLASFAASLDGRHIAGWAVAVAGNLISLFRAAGRNSEAVAVLEKSKAIGLRLELDRSASVPRGLRPKEKEEYRRLVQELRELRSERRGLDNRRLPPTEYAALLDQIAGRHGSLEQGLLELEARDPDSVGSPPDFPSLCRAAREWDLVIVYLYSTADPARGTEAYLIHPQSPLGYLPAADLLNLQGLSRPELDKLLTAGLQEIDSEALPDAALVAAQERGVSLGWITAYKMNVRAEVTPEWRKARAIWHHTMSRILDELRVRLGTPLASRLRKVGARRVVLIPDNRLSQFPLHAIPLHSGSERENHLGDEFVVSYAPSVASLLRCLTLAREAGRNTEPRLTAVVNPDGSIGFADHAVDAIVAHFNGRSQVAHGPAAQREWLLTNTSGADFLELFTHAKYSPGNPAQSYILLAHPDKHTVPEWWTKGSTAQLQAECGRLQLDDVWAGCLPLKPGCVVSADACETGQTANEALEEESPGFPAAFLGAGAASVIASLWAVDNLSTAWLMEKTYEAMLSADRLRPTEALQCATCWLRGLSRQEVEARLGSFLDLLQTQEEAPSEWVLEDRLRLYLIRRRLSEVKSGPNRPFAHPAYWAAFAAHGA